MWKDEIRGLGTKLRAAGATKILMVGGAVRDTFYGVRPTDYDIEVYGLTENEMAEALGVDGAVGNSFAVFQVGNLDFSAPRRERKIGKAHTDFEVTVDPNMTVKEAASRRDFTINAMAIDMDTPDLVIIDPFGGQRDLALRVLRHTSVQFAEDPLRVMRGVQLCGRFGLTAAPETVGLCRELVGEFGNISPERIWLEWEKWALKSVKPSKGLRFLADCGWIANFPILKALVHCPQDSKYHPEGSVWVHTLEVVDRAAELEVEGEDRVVLIMSALLHDVGKPDTTVVWADKITSRGHAKFGAVLARDFLEKMRCPQRIVERVVTMVRAHMWAMNPLSARAVRRLAVRLDPVSIAEFSMLVVADGGKVGDLLEKAQGLSIVNQGPEPIMMGRHLIAMGMTPGVEFGQILREAFEAQLDGGFEDVEGGMRFVRGL